MAIEGEILARIHDAAGKGEDTQRELYEQLLGRFVYLESLGLKDSPDYLCRANEPQSPEPQIQERIIFTRSDVIPGLDDPVYLQVVRKANPVFGIFDDQVTFANLRNSEEWKQMERTLLPTEGAIFHRAYSILHRQQLTLGDVRKSSVEKLLEIRRVGVKTAKFLINLVQPVNVDLNT